MTVSSNAPFLRDSRGLTMDGMPVGIMSWVLGNPFRAVQLAQAVGVKTMQLGCPSEKYDSGRSREDFNKFLKQSQIGVTAVFCGYTGESYANMDVIRETVGFRDGKFRNERVTKSFDISDFAKELGVKVVAVHAGFVPEDRGDRDYWEMVEAVQKVGEHCEKNAQCFALETGQEGAEALLRFIKDTERDNIRVNFDPANMLYYGSGNPIDGLEILKGYVVGVHCKDVKLPVTYGERAKEVPFGEGDVGAEKFIRKLTQIAYKGALTIEREVHDFEQQKRDMIEIKRKLERMRDKVLSCG